MAVYCHQCGNALPAYARFCSNCGQSIIAPQPMPGRPLMRPREGRQIAGVCIGLARANGWDVAVVRILSVIGLCVSGGVFGIAYLACWIGIPEEPLGLPSGTYPPSPGAYPPSI
jgi:phage shock protein C